MTSIRTGNRLGVACCCQLILLILAQCVNVNAEATQLTQANIDDTLASNQVVFINFYASWCRFSSMLQPIFDEAADKVKQLYSDPGKVVMGKVDCDSETNIASRFHISKYPTLKVVKYGQQMKREYRGQRSVEAFVEFIKKQLEDPIQEFQHLSELNNLDDKKRMIIGYFPNKEMPEYEIYKRVAINLKDDCHFHVGFGDAAREMHPPGVPIIVFRADKALSNENDETFTGLMTSFDELNIWAQEKCVPMVREITFENAEELTEEGLPFLILFHDPKDTETVKQFKDIVAAKLIDEKQNINFLTADGHRFAHPLHHLGKSVSDLPLIAIDSFRHMYLFPKFDDIYVEGKLKRFIEDLRSGKLHREFHYGPDPDSSTENSPPTTPPESTFKKLAPSNKRYTLLRDEL